jgi:hypothetical protein
VGAGEVPGGEDLSGDQTRSQGDIVVRVSQNDEALELKGVRRGSILLERDPRPVGLPAVDLDDEALFVPDEVDPRLRAVLRRRRRDAVTPAEAQEPVLQLGLREGRDAEVGPQPRRRPPRQRLLHARLVEEASELRPPHHAVQGLVIEGVCEVGEGPGPPW